MILPNVKIDERDLEMFRQMMSIILFLCYSRSPEGVENEFGYGLDREHRIPSSVGDIICSEQGLSIHSTLGRDEKFSTWDVKEKWSNQLQASLMYFCTGRRPGKTLSPSSCYYMAALDADEIRLMDIGNMYEGAFGNGYGNPRVLYPTILNPSAPEETFFQNSTVQDDFGQYYSVWKYYVSSLCKMHKVHDLHFYSVMEYETVQQMYDALPDGVWDEMVQEHHEVFMAEFGAQFI